jgi:outer membrane protein TolC
MTNDFFVLTAVDWFIMKISNIFRLIAIIMIFAMVDIIAQQNTVKTQPIIAADTLLSTKSTAGTAEKSFTAANSDSISDSTFTGTTLSNKAGQIDLLTSDTVGAHTSPYVSHSQNAENETISIQESFSDTLSDSSSTDSLPISEFVNIKSGQSQSDSAADTLLKRLLNDFGMKTLNLSLEEAINYLLQFNPLVIAAKLEWKSNKQKALAALGPFEPMITGGFRYNYTEYSYRPFPEENLDQSIGLKGRTASGAEYSFDYRVTDLRYSRSSLDQPQAFTGTTVTQPLLRNAWYGSELADRRVAKIDLEAAYNTYRSKLIEMIGELQSTYWNLAFAQEKFRFAMQSVQIAEKVVHDGRLRLKTGKMSNSDLMEAEAGLASRQANFADAGQLLLDAANQLKLLLSTDDIGNERLLFCNEKIFVNDSIETIAGSSDSLAVFEVTNHPEYKIRKLEVDKEDVILKYRWGQCLPELNAKFTCGISGYGQKASSAVSRLFNDPKPTWSTLLELQLPILGGVQSRNLLIAQKLKKDAAEKNLSAIKYQIENSMRIITQRVAALREQASKAGSVVKFRQKLLNAEFKKLDAGKSNNRLVFETEEKLSEAKQWQLENNVKYRIAIVQQAKISGSMLRDFALETVEDEKIILDAKLTSRKLKTSSSGERKR